MASVSLREIYKKYSGGVIAVSDFNIEIQDKEFIICTEAGVNHELKKQNPDKTFRAELQSRPDGSFSIVLYLADGQEEDPFYPEGAEVRFYTRDDTPEILFTPEEGTAHKSKTVFVDNTTPSQRYWFVPFIGNGMYKP